MFFSGVFHRVSFSGVSFLGDFVQVFFRAFSLGIFVRSLDGSYF